MRSVALPAVLLAASSCTMSFPGDPGAEETRTFEEAFEAGEVFDLRNINGAVRIAAWENSGEESGVEITARKMAGSPAALREMDVEIRQTGDGLRVRTRYPKRFFGRGWSQGQGRVHYEVRLPAAAEIRIETVNGPVEITGIEGRVEAQTVNGRIRMEDQRGQVTAKTVNGSIECGLGELLSGDTHSFRTVNGRVELTLEPGACELVDARAVNGRVRLELPDAENLDAPTRRGKRVRIGEGGGDCRIRTMNGAIRVASRD